MSEARPVRAMDIVVRRNFQRGKPHADMVACGYVFVCAVMDVARWQEQDGLVSIIGNEIWAVEQDEGTNLYAKGGEQIK